MKRCIVWLRRDLRIFDHEAFAEAIQNGYEILALYLYSNDEGEWGLGAASKWWLHHALLDFVKQVEAKGGRVYVKSVKGCEEFLLGLVSELKVDAVYWTRRYEPAVVERDKKIKKALKEAGVEVKSFAGNVLNEPHKVETKAGGPYQVFTPYWKVARNIKMRPEVEVAWNEAVFFQDSKTGSSVEELRLLPEIDWDLGIKDFWKPTRVGAEQRLESMRGRNAILYPDKRDLPYEDGTSLLSPYLHWGQISVKEVYRSLIQIDSVVVDEGLVRQLFWRDFAFHLIFYFPETPMNALREDWKLFPWENNRRIVAAWEKGATGYPIVDAAMKQLWQTGWMHNRCRMIVASFLVKHLQQDWMAGARWFWDTLVDADLANNTMGWQWTAGCGADAAPYFRIFNPIAQGQKFDREGDYVKKYLPILKDLPKKYIHEPWEAPIEVLESAGVRLGDNYPLPIVQHKVGRQRALEAYRQFKELKGSR